MLSLFICVGFCGEPGDPPLLQQPLQTSKSGIQQIIECFRSGLCLSLLSGSSLLLIFWVFDHIACFHFYNAAHHDSNSCSWGSLFRNDTKDAFVWLLPECQLKLCDLSALNLNDYFTYLHIDWLSPPSPHPFIHLFSTDYLFHDVVSLTFRDLKKKNRRISSHLNLHL